MTWKLMRLATVLWIAGSLWYMEICRLQGTLDAAAAAELYFAMAGLFVSLAVVKDAGDVLHAWFHPEPPGSPR